MPIPIDRTSVPRLDVDAVAAGRLTNVPADHMFIAEYSHGEWRKARIQPYRPIPLPPFALGLHYAQIVFEGMKAYRQQDGRVAVYRTPKHHARLDRSLARMCMPSVPQDLFAEAVHTLVGLDADWVPKGPDGAYYIRPFVIASEERMGLKVADEYLFMVIGGPFRPLFAKPLRVKVEREYVRAAPGGTGSAKCAGNYAAAMLPTKMAQEQGFDQVLWTDAREHHYIEESGATNVMFVIDGDIVTPPLTDTILDGVTRDSVITLARDMGYNVVERPVDVDELMSGIPSGRVTEAFGVGTAASIAPIGTINIDGTDLQLDIRPDRTMFALKERINAIRYGMVDDPYGWMHIVARP
jgi:branched-chain amino acid aminotransferase